MKAITEMNKAELLQLQQNSSALSKEDLLHIFNVFNGFWSYNYTAAEKGQVGLHAELKSGLCSDGFFYSKIVLDHSNLRKIIAANLVRQYQLRGLAKPDYVAGIPKGATKLGEDVAEIFGVKCLKLIKDASGNIKVVDKVAVEQGSTLLLVEDFTSTGSGFKETVIEIKDRYPEISILPTELVILNRGGIEYIPVGEYGFFDVLALVTHQINSWEKEICPLCNKYGSERIKPKKTDKNWELLVNSQN
jgi:orotate phosphoribosyltransferase